MKKAIYEQIVETIKSEEWDFDQVLEILIEKFPEEKPETLRSIVTLQYQKWVKKTAKSQTSDHKRRELFNEFNQALKSKDYKEGVIVELAKNNRFSPAQFAKIILEEHFKELEGEESVSIELKVKITKLIKNSALIDDQKLATEIWLATVKDNNYGPLSEFIKAAIGQDYEKKAKKSLERLGLSYQDEHDLKSKGYDKTPDIKLDIPFAYNGYVINWIESKALFGDKENHDKYLKEQLWSYWNRYGAGMVIYWFGFIEDLDNNRDNGIIVCDDFPKDIEVCNPLKNSSSEDEADNFREESN